MKKGKEEQGEIEQPAQECERILFDHAMTPWELVERVHRVAARNAVEVLVPPDHPACASSVAVAYLGQSLASREGVVVVCGDKEIRLQFKRAGFAVRSGEALPLASPSAGNAFEAWSGSRHTAAHDSPQITSNDLSNSLSSYMPRRHFKKIFSKPYLISTSFMVIVVLFLFSSVLPRAEVTVVAQTKEVTRKEPFTVDSRWKTVQDDSRHLRGKIMRKEGRGEVRFPITELSEGGARAQGTLSFENQTGNEVVVSPETPLVSEQGVAYGVDAAVTIPPARVADDNSVVFGAATASAHARSAGDDGNRSSGKLMISSLPPARQARAYAVISTPFTGGSNRLGRLVSEERIAEAMPRAREELTRALGEMMKEAAGGEWWYIAELSSVTTTAVSVSPEVGAETDEMALALNGTISTTLVAREDVLHLFELQEKDCARDRCRIKAAAVRQQDLALGLGAGELALVRTVTSGFQPEALKQMIAGKSVQDARHIILSTPGVQDARVALRMSIRAYLPRNVNHIEVRVE